MNNLFRQNCLSKPPTPHKPQKNKFNFKTAKNNTICSLNEVECFLNNFQQISRCLKFYKFFR